MRKPKKKIGIIIFHKNIKEIYEERWIQKCLDSIMTQTNQEFRIFEINYGGDEYSLIKEYYPKFRRLKFISEPLDNHAEAMNRIIDEAFSEGCEYVFNVNLDDYYEKDRIEKQLECLKMGYDVVSSDFSYIYELEGEDKFMTRKLIKQYGPIRENLLAGHNVIAHPSVAFSKKFWEGNRYDPSEVPMEDLLLWCRSIESGYKFYIHEDSLLNYRLHENQITGNNLEKHRNLGHIDDLQGPQPSNKAHEIQPLRNIKYDF